MGQGRGRISGSAKPAIFAQSLILQPGCVQAACAKNRALLQQADKASVGISVQHTGYTQASRPRRARSVIQRSVSMVVGASCRVVESAQVRRSKPLQEDPRFQALVSTGSFKYTPTPRRAVIDDRFHGACPAPLPVSTDVVPSKRYATTRRYIPGEKYERKRCCGCVGVKGAPRTSCRSCSWRAGPSCLWRPWWKSFCLSVRTDALLAQRK